MYLKYIRTWFGFRSANGAYPYYMNYDNSYHNQAAPAVAPAVAQDENQNENENLAAEPNVFGPNIIEIK